jgi:hypothetical protein
MNHTGHEPSSTMRLAVLAYVFGCVLTFVP